MLHAEDLARAFSGVSHPPDSFREAKARVVAKFERGYINGLLRPYGGNISRAARAAHKNRRVFWQLIQKHRIDPQRFRGATSGMGQ